MRKKLLSAILSSSFKILVIVFITVIYTGTSYSQNNKWSGKTPEEKASMMADRMKQNLSLSDDQYRQVYNLALEKAKMQSSNREKYKSMDKESRKSMKKQHREDFRKQLESILNQDQISKMKALRESHKVHKDGHKGMKNKNRDRVK